MKKFVIIYYNIALTDLAILYKWLRQQNIPLILENFAFFKNEFSLLENSIVIQSIIGKDNFIYLIELDDNNIININTNKLAGLIDAPPKQIELSLNAILDKINTSGIESLTEIEKKFLDNQ